MRSPRRPARRRSRTRRRHDPRTRAGASAGRRLTPRQKARWTRLLQHNQTNARECGPYACGRRGARGRRRDCPGLVTPKVSRPVDRVALEGMEPDLQDQLIKEQLRPQSGRSGPSSRCPVRDSSSRPYVERTRGARLRNGDRRSRGRRPRAARAGLGHRALDRGCDQAQAGRDLRRGHVVGGKQNRIINSRSGFQPPP